jgi:hypothetical protein
VLPEGEDAPAHDVGAGVIEDRAHASDPVEIGLHVVVGESHDRAVGLGDTRVAGMAQALPGLEEVAHAKARGAGEGRDHIPGAIR